MTEEGRGFSEMRFHAEEWGKVTLQEWLALAKRDPIYHGPRILQRLESFVVTVPEDYQKLSFREKITFLRTRQAELFNGDALQRIAEASKDPILDQITLTRSDLNTLPADFGVSGSRRALKEALASGIKVREAVLSLFGDRTEIVFVKVEENEYVIRLQRSPLTKDQIEQNFNGLPDLIPHTEIRIVSETLQGCEVLLLTEKLEHLRKATDQEIIDAARGLAQQMGFVPDIHEGNFVKKDDGTMQYIDGDALEYLLAKTDRALSKKDIVRLNEEIMTFQTGGKRTHKGSY